MVMAAGSVMNDPSSGTEGQDGEPPGRGAAAAEAGHGSA